jgi:hypothetical protein
MRFILLPFGENGGANGSKKSPFWFGQEQSDNTGRAIFCGMRWGRIPKQKTRHKKSLLKSRLSLIQERGKSPLLS